MSCLFIFSLCSLALGLVIHGYLGFSFHNGFAVLGGNVMRNLSTVRFAAQQQYFHTFYVVDQKLLEATGQHVHHFLVASITNVRHQDLALVVDA